MEKTIVHLIGGTHRDREWRYTFGQSTLRISHLLDGLLGILDSGPDHKHSIVDGDTVMLED